MTDPVSFNVSDRLRPIIEDVCRAIAAHAGRRHSAAPLVLVLWGYLRRLIVRLDRLATQPPGARQTGPSPHRTRSSAPRSRLRLPGGFAWLGSMVPETRCYGSQIRHLLASPEMAAFLAGRPQAVRILRPLCWMLGYPDALPPRRPAHPRSPAAPPTPRQAEPAIGAADTPPIPRGYVPA